MCSLKLLFTKEQVKKHFQNKTDEWKIKKAWTMGEYVIIEYANGETERLYKAKLEWIKELEPTVEIIS
jgi:hypothetical protein